MMPTCRANSRSAEEFGAEILKLCVEVGGVLTGEHGVGVEKRDLMPVMFSEIDLTSSSAEMRLRCRGPAQSRQGFSAAASLRRTGQATCTRRQAAVPRYSKVLIMRFGLFCSPKADMPGFGPETGRGFFAYYLDFNVRDISKKPRPVSGPKPGMSALGEQNSPKRMTKTLEYRGTAACRRERAACPVRRSGAVAEIPCRDSAGPWRQRRISSAAAG